MQTLLYPTDQQITSKDMQSRGLSVTAEFRVVFRNILSAALTTIDWVNLQAMLQLIILSTSSITLTCLLFL